MKFIVPAGIALCGYSPGSRIGFGEDLAPGVAREWRKWVLDPRYFLDDPTLTSLRNGANYHGSLLMLAPSDDLWITLDDVRGLATAFTGTQPDVRALVPAACGVDAIAHMGFFRSVNSPAWRVLAEAFALQGDDDGHAAHLRVHVERPA